MPRLRGILQRHPVLLQATESDALSGQVRLSVPVPPGSKVEALLADLCLERLHTLDPAETLNWDDALSLIKLWPGAEVLVTALEIADSLPALPHGRSEVSGSELLWYVVHRSRPVPGGAGSARSGSGRCRRRR